MVLSLLSTIYRQVTSLRNSLYDTGVLKSHTTDLPVISVGNITAGGNGKTPLVIYLSTTLANNGLKPVILSRGYGGSCSGPVLVGSSHTVQEVGDEPKMMAEKGFTVVVSRNRVAGAAFIASEKLGDVIILDDGFQHRRISRVVDIVTIDVSSEEAIEQFDREESLPKGSFRESLSDAKRRIDVIVLSSRSVKPCNDDVLDYFKKLFLQKPIFKSYLEAKLPENLKEGSDVVAVCGLANPEGFFETVRELGVNVVFEKNFGDHHVFTEREIHELVLKYHGVSIVCTEKDWVKLKKFKNKIMPIEAKSSVSHDFPTFLLDHLIQQLKNNQKA